MYSLSHSHIHTIRLPSIRYLEAWLPRHTYTHINLLLPFSHIQPKSPFHQVFFLLFSSLIMAMFMWCDIWTFSSVSRGIFGNQVQPSCHAITSPSNQCLEDGLGGSVVRTREIIILHITDALLENGAADIAIGISSPGHGGGDGIVDVHARDPTSLLGSVGTAVQSGNQRVGIRLSCRDGRPSGIFLRHVGVPDVVQVGRRATESDVDIVSTYIKVLIVQRLMNIADELFWWEKSYPSPAKKGGCKGSISLQLSRISDGGWFRFINGDITYVNNKFQCLELISSWCSWCEEDIGLETIGIYVSIKRLTQ